MFPKNQFEAMVFVVAICDTRLAYVLRWTLSVYIHQMSLATAFHFANNGSQDKIQKYRRRRRRCVCAHSGPESEQGRGMCDGKSEGERTTEIKRNECECECEEIDRFLYYICICRL